MSFFIDPDAYPELPPATPRPYLTRPFMWRWILLSFILHILLMALLWQYNLSSSLSLPAADHRIKPIDKQRIINAQLIVNPIVIPKAIPEVMPKAMPKEMSEVIPKEMPKIATKATTIDEPQARDEAEKLAPKLTDVSKAEKANTRDKFESAPNYTFSFNRAEPAILSATRSKLLAGKPLRSEVQEFFNTFNADAVQQNAQQAAQQFATDQISPELFPGAPVLTAAEQDAKQLFKAKIDVDCASDLNQILATISQFTIHAVVCQNKGNIDDFIQQRLAKKDSQERLQGLKPRAQRN